MSDRKKEIILKTLIVIGIGSLTALLLMIPLCMIVDTSVEKNFEATVTIGYIEMGLMMTSGILLLILQLVWGGLKQKPVTAERLTSPYQSYEAVVSHIKSSLAMMLHNCLDRAVREHLILRNLTEGCVIPKLQKQEIKILHPDHISAYLNAADVRGVLPMFFLELTGLRKGELVALLWEDLDIERMTLSVTKQGNRAKGGGILVTQPKTETSMRQISVPPETIGLLQKEHDKHPENPYMFPSPVTGSMYYPDSVSALHRKILKDAGLEHIRFHDLRHTFATLALQNGVDVKTLSTMLGHYDAGFTLRTYTHTTRQAQADAAQKMGSFMAGAI